MNNKQTTALQNRLSYLLGFETGLGFALRYEQYLEDNHPMLRIHLRSDHELKLSRQETEEKLSTFCSGIEQDAQSSAVYQAGYLAALNLVLFMLNDSGRMSIRPPATTYNAVAVTHTLDYYRLFTAGRANAMQFAIENHGEKSILDSEIQEVRDNIARNEGPMAIGASPRKHQEGYLDGLLEAIDIINGDLRRQGNEMN
jgi:hypothetical protein